jgi:hypothetical protein
MSYVIKFDPKSLQDYVYPTTQVKKVVDRYVRGKDLRPLILHGTNGVGKSCLARLLPTAMEGRYATAHIVNGYEFGEVHEVKKLFGGPPMYFKLFSEAGQKRRYIIINEANLSYKAALAMRDIIDDMQEQVQLIFTTNLFEQMDIGIRDRSTCLLVGAADANAWLPRAEFILQQEGIKVPKPKLLQMLTAQLQVSASNRRLLEYLQTFVEDLRNKGNEGGDTQAANEPVVQPPSQNYNPLGPVLQAA